MSRQDANSLEEELEAAERHIRELEIELQSVHTRLRAGHNKPGLGRPSVFFQRVRYWLWSGPADQRRQKARELAKRVLQKIGLYRLAAWGWRQGAAS